MSALIVLLQVVAVVSYLLAVVLCGFWARRGRGWTGTISTLVPGLLLLLLMGVADLVQGLAPGHRAAADIYSDSLAVLVPVMWAFLVLGFVRDMSTRELETSDRMHRTLLEHVPHAVFALNEDLRLLAAAGNVQGLSGYKPDELIGLSGGDLTRLLYHQARDGDGDYAERLARMSGDFQGEVRITRKGGEVRMAEVFLTRTQDTGGRPSGYIGIARDITDEHATERQYQTLVETMGDGIAMVDQRGRITYVNDALCQMLAHAAEELVGTPLEDLCSEASRPVMRARLAELLGGARSEYELALRAGSGREVFAMVTATPLHDAAGEVTGSFALVKDITGRKQTETEVLQLAQFRESIIDSAEVWLHVLDQNGKVLVWNRAAERISGYSRDDVVGGDEVWDRLCLTAGHATQPGGTCNPFLDQEQPLEDFETTIRSRGGQTRIISWTSRKLVDPAGGALGSIAIGQDVTQLRQAQAQVEAAHERLDRIVQMVEALIVGLDGQGRITLFNRRCEEVTGYSAEEALGRVIWDFLVAESHREQVREAFEALRTSDRTLYAENPWVTKNGEERLITWRSTPVRVGDEAVREIVVIGLDITEHRAAELSVRQSEERFRRLFEQSPIGIAVFTQEGRPVAVNETLSLILGIEGGAEMEALPLLEVLRIRDEDLQRVREGSTVAYEVQLDFPDPRLPSRRYGTAHLAATVTPLTPGDATSGMIVQVQDVTERKASQQALMDSEERLRNLVEIMSDWAWEVDMDTVYTAVSGNCEEILGYTAEEILGRTPYDLMPEDEAVRVRQIVEECIREGKPIVDLENWNLHRDGHLVCLLTNGMPILNERGRVVGYRGVDRDITERVELRRQLEHAQRLEALGTLARGVAHDFNNVLQALLGHITLFQMDKRPSDRDWARLKAMSDQIDHGARLVSQLLDFSRGAHVERGPVSINHIIQRTVEMLRSTMQRTIVIRTELAEDAWTVEADSDRLGQVFTNLAVNARDAMPNGGTLGFHTENVTVDEEFARGHPKLEAGPHVLISVVDTGTGMDEETVERVFEPFFTTKPIGKGTGLGLAMVHGIVEAHGGHIEVYSRLGTGTTFRIYLPAKPALRAAPVEEEAVRGLPGGSETVLVAADEPGALRFAADGLSAYGYTVITASTEREALSVFEDQHHQIDLVLLDAEMADMDTLDCLYRILSLDPQALVVVSSADTPDGQVEVLLQNGAKDHLAKPFTLVALLTAVREVLDASQGGG